VGHKSGSSLRPWFQFYAADFLGSTLTWTDEQVGSYLRLLSHQWINGEVPVDDADAMSMISRTYSKHAAKLAPKFPDGMNAKLEVIRGEMIETSERRQAAGRKGASVRYGHVQDSPDEDPEQNGEVNSPASSPASAIATGPATGPAIALKPIPTPTPKLIPKSKLDHVGGPISPQMWEAFRAIYPERQGTQGWSKAKVKAARLIASGEQWADIMSGARRYRDQQEAAGKIGSEFIKRAEYFLAADARLWTEDYPVSQTNQRTSKNVAAAKRFIDAGQ
jgi:hypothetical protein